MKKLFTIFTFVFVLVFALGLNAQTGSDWKWMHETPQGNTLRFVKYWDANNWYAIGYAGTFMKTTNAGLNWTFNHLAMVNYGASGQKNTVYDAHFFNQNTGIIVGQGSASAPEYHFGIVRTTNGGTSFDSVSASPFTTGTFYQVYFRNNNAGYAVGTGTPKLYVTNDGGLTWTGITTAPTTTLYDVYASDSLHIIVSTTAGNVAKSIDAGATWTTISTGASATLYKMEFINSNVGFVSGTASAFRYTMNAGLNWITPTNTGLVSATTFYDMDVRGSSSTIPPFVETFANTTFPPTGWVINNPTTTYWQRYDSSAFGVGLGAAKYYFWSASTGVSDTMTSPSFTSTSAGDSLLLDVAYQPYSGSNDMISVQTSTNGGNTFTQLVLMDSTIMRTVPGAVTHFYPNRYQWKTLRYVVPAGTNKVRFVSISAFGNDAYLDNVTIKYLGTATNASVWLTGNSSYIYKSTNLGTSWDTVGFTATTNNQPWTSTYYATDLSTGGDTLITVGAFGLINRRVSAATRTIYSNVIKPGTIYDAWGQGTGTGTIITVGASTIAGSVFDQIIRSTNGGSTWAVVPFSTTSTAYFNDIEMINDNTGYIVGSNSAVYRTTNAGANWDSVTTTGITGGLNLGKACFINANTGWIFSKSQVTTDSTIFKTTDAGATWTKQGLIGASGSSRSVYGASMIDANTGYCVSWAPLPYKTTDGGATWNPQTIVDAAPTYMYAIKMLTANIGYIASTGGKVYKTTNGGILWDTLTMPTRSYTNYALDFVTPSTGMVVGSSGTCWYTTNSGLNWITKNTNSYNTIYGCQMFSNTTSLSVGATGAILKNSVVITGGNLSEEEVPTTYQLMQNYPNPFNPSTTIKFALPKASNVTIKIYDVAGREIMRLLNSEHLNPGVQKYTFEGSRFASGVYFYSLIVDNKLIDTKKMVLIK
jgi:photosystem II stability/assembly factor-like uncharacterized protein